MPLNLPSWDDYDSPNSKQKQQNQHIIMQQQQIISEQNRIHSKEIHKRVRENKERVYLPFGGGECVPGY